MSTQAMKDALTREASARPVNVDVENVMRLGRRARRRRQTAAAVASLVAIGLVGTVAVNAIDNSVQRLAGGSEAAEATTATSEGSRNDPSPGDPNYAWPTSTVPTTVAGWWNSPESEQAIETAEAHPMITVVDTSTMTVVELIQLAPVFHEQTPVDPVPVGGDWPTDALVILDAETFDVLDTAELPPSQDPNIYWPLEPDPTPVAPDVELAWSDLVPGYTLEATSAGAYGSDQDLFLYSNGTTAAVLIVVDDSENQSLPPEPGNGLDLDELEQVEVAGLADAAWGESIYGATAVGVNSIGDCGLIVTHQQTAAPVVALSQAQVDELVQVVLPAAAGLACQ